MFRMENKASVIHIYLCGMLNRRWGNRIYHINEVKSVIKFYVKLPKHLQNQIINEMIEYNLLKRIDRDNFCLVMDNINIRKPLCDCYGDPLW